MQGVLHEISNTARPDSPVGADLLFCGDFFLTPDYLAHAAKMDSGIFHDALPVIKSSDYAFLNLEAPATRSEKKLNKCGLHQKTAPETLEFIRRAGFFGMGLANNHIMDYGVQGLMDTLKTARLQNLLTTGAGETLQEAKAPIIVEVNGVKCAIFAFGENEFNALDESRPGALVFDPYSSLDYISQAQETAQFIAVLFHGGIERYPYPSPLLQNKCRAMARAGADIVLCQHSHMTGSCEWFDGSFIIYGQGNFMFGYRQNEPDWNEGVLVGVDISPKQFKVRLTPVMAAPDGIYLGDASTLDKLFSRSADIVKEGFVKERFLEFAKANASWYLPQLYGRSRLFNKLNRLLNNRPIELLYNKRARITTLNLLRCQPHAELLIEMLQCDPKLSPE